MADPLHFFLPPDLLSILRCPACQSELKQQDKGCTCIVCGKEFPYLRGVLRFVDPQNYAESFGYQWQTFSTTQLLPDFAELNLLRKTGLREEDFKGKLVLDVGCGMGRFADVATRWGARVIGIDLSEAAEVAVRNLADRDFAAFQADLMALPFALESFDCIYSIGVLHHTPDCERAFKSLPKYLKPGGSIAVWLYSGYNNWYRFSDHYRKITHRIPIRRLHSLLRVAVPCLYWSDRALRAVPLIGRPIASFIHHLFPISRVRNPQVRILDTLDWYSPKYQSKHTYEQVFRWFEYCGLEDLTVAEVSIGVKGRKRLQVPFNAANAGESVQVRIADSQPNPATAPKTDRAVPIMKFPLYKKVQRTMRWFPSYAWQRVTRRAVPACTHLMIMIADHFEPAIVPHDGAARAPFGEQEMRVERWCSEYPKAFQSVRDHDGRPLVHTYFYPAEQYERCLLQRLAAHCQDGWGEIETHLHHSADTAENTRRQLVEFRDTLAMEHGCLSYMDGEGPPRYAFVHGNFALANSAGGINCGVDSEIQVLGETGCYADFTLPPGPFYRTHIAKINSLYECTLPLDQPAAHRTGRDLKSGRAPRVFPLIVEGPLMLSLRRPGGSFFKVENGDVTANNPPCMHRLKLWKRAAVSVKGRPDWLFIKLQCHGMDPRDNEVMMKAPIRQFLSDLFEGAQERCETIHFVTAREMVNIILAACDGHEGNPGAYRDYRLKRLRAACSRIVAPQLAQLSSAGLASKS